MQHSPLHVSKGSYTVRMARSYRPKRQSPSYPHPGLRNERNRTRTTKPNQLERTTELACRVFVSSYICYYIVWRAGTTEEQVVKEKEADPMETTTTKPKVDFATAWTLLDVHDDTILASKSTPNSPPCLMLGRLDGDKIIWTQLSKSAAFPEMKLQVQVHKITPERLNPEYPSVTEIESLLLSPSDVSKTNKSPLILFPHGGPHSRFTAGFAHSLVGLIQCGFSVVLVNFRASTGYGQDYVLSLPGNVGNMDVKDCMHALTETLALGTFDEEKLLVMGGSHGGLLTTYLVGQYPQTFKAAIARNPVVNMTSMYHMTDIPDWLHVELFKRTTTEFDKTYVPTPADYAVFHQASPLRYIDQVKTPVMLMLGLVDKRVPCYQGEEYYRHLKARGIPTRLHRYPESNHPLQEVEVEADNFVNMIQWFSQFI